MPSRTSAIGWGLAVLVAAALLLWIGLRGGGPPPEEPGATAGPDAPSGPSAPSREVAPPAVAPGPDAPAAPLDPSLPHTDLPLRLVATVVRDDRALSLATVEDLERTRHQVIAEGQAFRGHPRAVLERIERRRLILDNDGVREQLVLDPADRAPEVDLSALAPTEEQLAHRRAMASRLRAITDAGPGYLDGGERSGLLAEGEVSAVYEDGEMVGVRLDEVVPGGLYDRVGLRSGDVVTSINGVPMGDPTAAADVLVELAVADVLEVAVEGDDGETGTISVPTEELIPMLQDLE
ncbi:MAG: PDZ domain-containing protein [Myxococcota bacterium]